jgi:tRNA 2-thiouridine synthesizing protein A
LAGNLDIARHEKHNRQDLQIEHQEPPALEKKIGSRQPHHSSSRGQEVEMTADKDINVVGKACPLPLIALARAVRGMQPGQVVKIVGNDPIFESSVVDFCQERGHALLETLRDGRTVTMSFTIGQGSSSAA